MKLTILFQADFYKGCGRLKDLVKLVILTFSISRLQPVIGRFPIAKETRQSKQTLEACKTAPLNKITTANPFVQTSKIKGWVRSLYIRHTDVALETVHDHPLSCFHRSSILFDL